MYGQHCPLFHPINMYADAGGGLRHGGPPPSGLLSPAPFVPPRQTRAAAACMPPLPSSQAGLLALCSLCSICFLCSLCSLCCSLLSLLLSDSLPPWAKHTRAQTSCHVRKQSRAHTHVRTPTSCCRISKSLSWRGACLLRSPQGMTSSAWRGTSSGRAFSASPTHGAVELQGRGGRQPCFLSPPWGAVSGLLWGAAQLPVHPFGSYLRSLSLLTPSPLPVQQSFCGNGELPETHTHCFICKGWGADRQRGQQPQQQWRPQQQQQQQQQAHAPLLRRAVQQRREHQQQ